MPLSNLKELRCDMERKEWSICCFVFWFKKIEYFVLVKRFVETEKRKNEYASVKLHFVKSNDSNYELEVEANSRQLLTDAKTIREYFGIEYANNLGDILQQFNERLGSVIPRKVPENYPERQKEAMIRSLSKSDSEDPNKIYCNKVKRNPKGCRRSVYNAEKTRFLRPSLFEFFRTNLDVSFCYYADRAMENDDATILRNFSENPY